MRHIHSYINSVYGEICGRYPSQHEIEYHTRYLLTHPRNKTHVYDAVFAKHLRKQASRFVVFPPNMDTHDGDAFLAGSALLVLGMVRNIAGSLPRVKRLIEGLRKYFQKVCFYFYHNNSSDNSEDLLREWMDEDPYVSGTFAPPVKVTTLNSGGGIGNRIPMFARMRNQNITDALDKFGDGFDYVCMTNTDFIEDIDVTGVVKSLGLRHPWSIICGNCCFDKSFFHYDVFALRLQGEPEDPRELYEGFDRSYGVSSEWVDRLYIFDGWTKVRSGFGDMCIIKMPALLNLLKMPGGEVCRVDESKPRVCELISMCDRVSGDVWVSPHIVYPATLGIGSGEPLCFVPRDAGFFSVFNFFIGGVFAGHRLYPYYNKEAFLKVNKENKHFCYWGASENSWFEFFEPVRFYHGDVEHDREAYTTYKTSYGETAGGEFRHPNIYSRMMSRSDLWKPWRVTVNAVYKRYVRVKPSIETAVEDLWKGMFGVKGCAGVIGVHYRHPSHYVESGKVYLRDYFEKVDKILETVPDASIFLATDNELGVVAFTYRYGGGRVKILPGIKRVDVDNILEWAHAKGATGAKSDNMDFVEGQGFQLHYTICQEASDAETGNHPGVNAGRDVLMEAMCLARCRWVVHTLSNVALAVSYMNPTSEMCLVSEKNKLAIS